MMGKLTMDEAINRIRKIPNSDDQYRLQPVGLDQLEVIACGKSTGIFFDVEDESSAQYLIDIINSMADIDREKEIVSILNMTVNH
jgi:hypothetical protein